MQDQLQFVVHYQSTHHPLDRLEQAQARVRVLCCSMHDSLNYDDHSQSPEYPSLSIGTPSLHELTRR